MLLILNLPHFFAQTLNFEQTLIFSYRLITNLLFTVHLLCTYCALTVLFLHKECTDNAQTIPLWYIPGNTDLGSMKMEQLMQDINWLEEETFLDRTFYFRGFQPCASRSISRPVLDVIKFTPLLLSVICPRMIMPVLKVLTVGTILFIFNINISIINNILLIIDFYFIYLYRYKS